MAKTFVETYIPLLMQWHETQGKGFRKKHGTLNTLLKIVYSQAFLLFLFIFETRIESCKGEIKTIMLIFSVINVSNQGDTNILTRER